MRELGQLIGAAIQLSLNVNNGSKGKVSYTTYLILIGLQCLGLPLALLVSPPEKIIHTDGHKTVPATKKPVGLGEFRNLWALLKKKQVFLLIPILVGFQWNGTYLGIYLTNYFSVRSRTLGSLVSGVVATFANIFWGWFLDRTRWSRPALAKGTWLFFATFMLALFGWQFANEKLYETTTPKVTLDWATPGFGRGFASMVLMRFVSHLGVYSMLYLES